MQPRTPVPGHLQPQPAADKLTDKQESYLRDLLAKRQLDPERKARALAILDSETEYMTRAQARASITWLLTQPRGDQSLAEIWNDDPASGFPDVPAGRYAVMDGDTLKFYRVDRPTEGRWAGYTFLKVQASDDLYPVKNPGTKRLALEAIAVDPAEASRRYGRELGKCGVCGRTLTDETSRALGIGPVCRDQTGW